MTSDPLPDETGSPHDTYAEPKGPPEISGVSESASACSEAPANGRSKALSKKKAKRESLVSDGSFHSPGETQNAVWEELVKIEQQIVHPGSNGKQHPKGAKGGWSRLKLWLKSEISPSGFVRRDPRRTFDAVTPLVWIREAGTKKGWTREFEKIFLLILQASAQLARHEGRLFHDDLLREKELKRSIRPLANDKKLRPWGGILEDLRTGKVGRKHRRQCELGIECDQSRVGILRSDWTADSAHIGIDFSSSLCHLDVRLMNQTIIRTPWETRIFIDGDEFSTSQPWENIGWNADDFGQYIELKQEVAEGVTIERVLFVPRRTTMVLLFDVLRASSAARTRIEWSLTSPNVTSLKPLGNTRLVRQKVWISISAFFRSQDRLESSSPAVR